MNTCARCGKNETETKLTAEIDRVTKQLHRFVCSDWRTCNETTYLLQIGTDTRECKKDGDYYIHTLNTNFRIHQNDPTITKITPTTH